MGIGECGGAGELRLWAPLLGLFWLSIGLENVGDIIADIEQAQAEVEG